MNLTVALYNEVRTSIVNRCGTVCSRFVFSCVNCWPCVVRYVYVGVLGPTRVYGVTVRSKLVDAVVMVVVEMEIACLHPLAV